MNPDTQKYEPIKNQKDSLFRKIVNKLRVDNKPDTVLTGCTDETQDLIERIKDARNEWITANVNFDYISDQEVIDYYTYKIKACQIRYEYFLKMAKEQGIKISALL